MSVGARLVTSVVVLLLSARPSGAAPEPRDLFSFRVHRIQEHYRQSSEKRAFDQKLKALLAGATANLEAIAPYETCVEHHKKLNLGKLGAVDLAEALCREEGVQKNETEILQERADGNKGIAGLERSFRLVALMSETMSAWRREMAELSKAFELNCNGNVPCLEKKQFHRYRQLLVSVGALDQVDTLARNIGAQLPNTSHAFQAGRIRDDFEKSVNAVLADCFEKIAKREDLPW